MAGKKSGKTKDKGKGTVNCNVNMPEWMRDQLQALCDKSGYDKLGTYLKAVLIQAVRSQVLAKDLKSSKNHSTGLPAELCATFFQRGPGIEQGEQVHLTPSGAFSSRPGSPNQ